LNSGFKTLEQSGKENTQAIIASQTVIKDAITNQTQVIYDSTDRIVAENKATRAEITKFGNTVEEYLDASEKPKDCTNFCRLGISGVVGTLKGAVETTVGFLETMGCVVTAGIFCGWWD